MKKYLLNVLLIICGALIMALAHTDILVDVMTHDNSALVTSPFPNDMEPDIIGVYE